MNTFNKKVVKPEIKEDALNQKLSIGDYVCFSNNIKGIRNRFGFIRKINNQMITVQFISESIVYGLKKYFILSGDYDSRVYPNNCVKIFSDHPFINSEIEKIKNDYLQNLNIENGELVKLKNILLGI